MKRVFSVVLACAVTGCAVFSPSPKPDQAKKPVAAHSESVLAAQDKPVKPDKPDKGPVVSTSCDAADVSGKVFTDPNATVRTSTNKQVTHVVCHGRLPDGATLPTAEISFESGDGKTTLTCLDSWHESIQIDGSFTKSCLLKAKKHYWHHCTTRTC